MKTINVVNGPANAAAIILGCMRMPALDVEAAEKMIHSAVELGVNFFDNATCYSRGVAEERFGEAFDRSGIRKNADFVLRETSSTGQRKIYLRAPMTVSEE